MSWETLAAAQQIAAELGVPVHGGGHRAGSRRAGCGLAGRKLDTVYAVEHALLQGLHARRLHPGAAAVDRAASARSSFCSRTPTRCATSLPQAGHRAWDACWSSDVIAHRMEDGKLILMRQLFQGKLNADIALRRRAAVLRFAPGGRVPRRPGGGRARAGRDASTPELAAGRDSHPAAAALPRRRSARWIWRPPRRIVSVGRGIKEAENIPLVQKLADALGAELAASRPICDSRLAADGAAGGQLRPDRGAEAVHGRRHLRRHPAPGRHEGLASTIVAINKDPDAPIFEVADYGIVGDLFRGGARADGGNQEGQGIALRWRDRVRRLKPAPQRPQVLGVQCGAGVFACPLGA